jgi:hypothetical protein
MSRISDFLRTQPDASANRGQIEKGAGVHTTWVGKALEQIVAEGWVLKFSGGKGKADRYCLRMPFDPLAPLPNNPVVDDEF